MFHVVEITVAWGGLLCGSWPTLWEYLHLCFPRCCYYQYALLLDLAFHSSGHWPVLSQSELSVYNSCLSCLGVVINLSYEWAKFNFVHRFLAQKLTIGSITWSSWIILAPFFDREAHPWTWNTVDMSVDPVDLWGKIHLFRPRLKRSHAFSIFTYPCLKNTWFGRDWGTELRLGDLARKKNKTYYESRGSVHQETFKDRRPEKQISNAWRPEIYRKVYFFEQNSSKSHVESVPSDMLANPTELEGSWRPVWTQKVNNLQTTMFVKIEALGWGTARLDQIHGGWSLKAGVLRKPSEPQSRYSCKTLWELGPGKWWGNEFWELGKALGHDPSHIVSTPTRLFLKLLTAFVRHAMTSLQQDATDIDCWL